MLYSNMEDWVKHIKERMKESNSHYWKGKKFSEETRRKMSEAHIKKNKNE